MCLFMAVWYNIWPPIDILWTTPGVKLPFFPPYDYNNAQMFSKKKNSFDFPSNHKKKPQIPRCFIRVDVFYAVYKETARKNYVADKYSTAEINKNVDDESFVF